MPEPVLQLTKEGPQLVLHALHGPLRAAVGLGFTHCGILRDGANPLAPSLGESDGLINHRPESAFLITHKCELANAARSKEGSESARDKGVRSLAVTGHRGDGA